MRNTMLCEFAMLCKRPTPSGTVANSSFRMTSDNSGTGIRLVLFERWECVVFVEAVLFIVKI